MKESEELVVLFSNSNEMIVQSIQNILSNNNIPSIHISSGNKIPRPVGLRVKKSDYEDAFNLIKDMNFTPKKSSTLNEFQKSQRIGCFIYIGIGFIYLLYQIIKEVI